MLLLFTKITAVCIIIVKNSKFKSKTSGGNVIKFNGSEFARINDCAIEAITFTRAIMQKFSFTRANNFVRMFHARFEENLASTFPMQLQGSTVQSGTYRIAENLEVEVLSVSEAYREPSKKSLAFDMTPDLLSPEVLYSNQDADRMFRGQLVFNIQYESLESLVICSRYEAFPPIVIPLEKEIFKTVPATTGEDNNSFELVDNRRKAERE